MRWMALHFMQSMIMNGFRTRDAVRMYKKGKDTCKMAYNYRYKVYRHLVMSNYLDNIWGTLSSSDILELQKESFIPVANDTRITTVSVLYVQLGLDLAPFALELPGLYLPYVRILREIRLGNSNF